MDKHMVRIDIIDETEDYYDIEMTREINSVSGIITGLRKPKGVCKTVLLYKVRYNLKPRSIPVAEEREALFNRRLKVYLLQEAEKLKARLFCLNNL